MNTKIISSFILTSAAVILATGCTCTKVNTSWGTQVSVSKCIQQIKYSGNSFKIGEATIPLGLEKVIIKGVEWDTKKLQDAVPAIQAMEQTRLRLCEERVIDMQTLKYDDYLAKDKKRQENQEKLDQLAYLVALNNPQAVEKWIDNYMTTITVVTKDNKSLSTLGSSEIHLKMVPKDVAVQDVSTFLK
ncbi:hypothetical protein [Sulfurimonas sp.]|uniref:hypothetical protein n=1 Tax=Sulfurimonas sp. TaxID=2022749 RepID=UPI00286DBEA5|nr:hypothetical protein [Sulfurimonas sp.]